MGPQPKDGSSTDSANGQPNTHTSLTEGEHQNSAKYYGEICVGPILDDRLKEKFLKP